MDQIVRFKDYWFIVSRSSIYVVDIETTGEPYPWKQANLSRPDPILNNNDFINIRMGLDNSDMVWTDCDRIENFQLPLKFNIFTDTTYHGDFTFKFAKNLINAMFDYNLFAKTERLIIEE